MKLELIFFKKSGKYYTEETITIPDSIPFWDIKAFIRDYYIKENRLIDMTCYGLYYNDVPFLCKIYK